MATAANVDPAVTLRLPAPKHREIDTEEAALGVLHDLDCYLEAEITAVRHSLYCDNALDYIAGSSHACVGGHICAKCATKEEKLCNSTSSNKTISSNESTADIETAVKLGHVECLREILRHRTSSLSQSVKFGCTFVKLATECGHRDVLDLLIRHELGDPDVCLDTILNEKDSLGRCAIHIAAQAGHVESLRVILRYTGKSWEKITSADGRTAVHFAAAGGALKCLHELRKDIDNIVNVKDHRGMTPVYLAAENGQTECLQWLLENTKADPHLVAKDGSNPLHAAAAEGHLQCVHWLVRRHCFSLAVPRSTDSATPLHLAAAKGRTNVLQWALQQRLCSGSEIDRNGRTPVHYAALNDQVNALKVFLRFQPIDVNAEDNDSRTPRDLAEENGHRSCSALLNVTQSPPRKRGSLVNRLTRTLSGPARTDRNIERRASMKKTRERGENYKRNVNNNAGLSVHYLDLSDDYGRKHAPFTVHEERMTAQWVAQAGLVPLFAACPDRAVHAVLKKLSPGLFKKT